jgi:hypothetical protein
MLHTKDLTPNAFILFLFNLYLTRQVSKEQSLIYNDGLGTVGSLPCAGAERPIFTLSARGFDRATFQLLPQRSDH